MAMENASTKGSEHSPSATVNDDPAHGFKEDAQIKDYPSRRIRAEEIIRSNVLWSLGAGVLPLPVFDILAITAVELKMLKNLSTLYGVKFSEGLVKKLVVSLISSVGSVGIGTVIGGSLLKLIPTVGTALGVASVPVLAGTLTHALGRVFVMHFELGGTFLDFDAQKMRHYFQQEFESAKEAITKLQKEQQAKKQAQKPESSLVV